MKIYYTYAQPSTQAATEYSMISNTINTTAIRDEETGNYVLYAIRL